MHSNTIKIDNKGNTKMVAHRGASGLEREIDYDMCSFGAWANAKHSDNDWVIEKFVV